MSPLLRSSDAALENGGGSPASAAAAKSSRSDDEFRSQRSRTLLVLRLIELSHGVSTTVGVLSALSPLVLLGFDEHDATAQNVVFAVFEGGTCLVMAAIIFIATYFGGQLESQIGESARCAFKAGC